MPPTDKQAGLLATVGAIVAPTTLLTAVMYYFGWSFSVQFFQYFSVNSTTLGLGTQDYLLRSADPMFVPVTVAVAAGLLSRWAYVELWPRLPCSLRACLVRIFVPAAAVVGLLLIALGFWRVLGHTEFEFHYEFPPLGLAIGVLLLFSASVLRRRGRGADPGPGDGAGLVEKVAVAFLVSISLFWATQLYAAQVGITRAHQQETELESSPYTALYSTRGLGIRADGVTEQVCGSPNPMYQFRYDGLVLVLQSGGQYLLLPRTWSTAGGPAILLPRNDSVRLEFTQPDASGSVGGPC